MIQTKLILDLGSCHMGKMAYLQEALALCELTQVPYLKLQLFPKEKAGNNNWLDPYLFKDFYQYSVETGFKTQVFASVFDDDSYIFLKSLKVPTIKFSHSMRFRLLVKQAVQDFKQVFVSYSFLDPIEAGVIPLLCIPEYPVLYQLDLNERLFLRFRGFSDHTLGISQTKKLMGRLEFIEKHITLNHIDINCPDALFAIKPSDLLVL